MPSLLGAVGLAGAVLAAAALGATHRSPPLPGRRAPAPGPVGCPWLVPVEAPVVDRFRPPANPYGPGNLGLEYASAEGQDVVAVAPGRVGFNGPVAGRRYLVIEHPGGLRSTYGPLASVAVVTDQEVGAGARIGTAAPGLHLTARSGDRYLDPEPLLAGRCGRVRLVPPNRSPPSGADRSAS